LPDRTFTVALALMTMVAAFNAIDTLLVRVISTEMSALLDRRSSNRLNVCCGSEGGHSPALRSPSRRAVPLRNELVEIP
jgi:hypothetical protein